jgi:predicted NBD/HSP70 family sugar kinase
VTTSSASRATISAATGSEAASARTSGGSSTTRAWVMRPMWIASAALVLGLDLGARFLRGAICDLRGEIRARQDVEIQVADAERAVEEILALRTSLVEAAGLEARLLDGVVVGVPGVVETPAGRLNLATNVAGLDGREFGTDLQERLGLSVTLENDANLAALGEQRLGVARGVENFVFLSVGTGFGAGLVLHGELHRGQHGAAGEVDYALPALGPGVDPSAGAVAELAARLADEAGSDTALAPPYDPRAIFASARGGDAVARAVVDELARRIALHVAPIGAVADVEFVVLGGGLGRNGDLLLEPIRRLLREWLPYPPRVEVSTVGDAAVLAGALSVGLRSALDNVFVELRRT